jgi:hypothetical protein
MPRDGGWNAAQASAGARATKILVAGPARAGATSHRLAYAIVFFNLQLLLDVLQYPYVG